MARAKLEPLPKFDLGTKMVPWKQRHAEGKDLRRAVPRESHADWKPGRNRSDPLKLLAISNQGRQAHLVPLRMGRMPSSPFACLRGAACVMAADLSTSLISGNPVVMDGDAHINNFGMYGTPQRDVVFDLDDFDEATIGPWEWDLKRLVASVNVAGRQNGLNRRPRAAAVKRGLEGYRFSVNRLQSMGARETPRALLAAAATPRPWTKLWPSGPRVMETRRSRTTPHWLRPSKRGDTQAILSDDGS